MLHGLVEDLSQQELTLEDMLKMHLTESAMLGSVTADRPLSELIATMQSFLEERTLAEGSVLFDVGDDADGIFIVLSGSVVSMMDFLRFDECAPAAVPVCAQRPCLSPCVCDARTPRRCRVYCATAAAPPSRPVPAGA